MNGEVKAKAELSNYKRRALRALCKKDREGRILFGCSQSVLSVLCS